MNIKENILNVGLFLSIIILSCSNVYSQNGQSIDFSYSIEKDLSDTSNNCNIVMNSRSVYNDVQMFGLKDSTVNIMKDEKTTTINVNDIRTIKFLGKGFWKGAMYGGGAGFLTGIVIGLSEGSNYSGHGSRKSNFGAGVITGIVLAVPFGLVGGGVGSFLAKDHLYDMGGYSYIKKRSMVYKLMKEYPDY